MARLGQRDAFHMEDLHFWLTSVAMTHSLLSSAITNTDWYMESLEEHIVDILHSGFSLQNTNHVTALAQTRSTCQRPAHTCTAEARVADV